MRKLAFAVSILLVGGCSLMPQTKPVEVKTIAMHAPMYHPPLPMEMQLTDVQFEILTPDTMTAYLGLIDENKAPRKPYYALTTKQYENLAMNMAEIKRYTKNILTIVKFYRDYDKEE